MKHPQRSHGRHTGVCPGSLRNSGTGAPSTSPFFRMPFLPFFLRAAGLGIMFAVIPAVPAADAALPASNPFSQESTLPFQYPRFDLINDEHYAPAFAAGMAEQLKEVDAIARRPEKPTFENTLVALEKSGALLGRVNRTFSNIVGTLTNDTLRATTDD